jgi:hypothetical protein
VPDDKTETLEQRIRSLCGEVVKSTSEESLQVMCAELRGMLSEHIEQVRAQVRELQARELKTQELKVRQKASI